jgi:hypothetical protein
MHLETTKLMTQKKKLKMEETIGSHFKKKLSLTKPKPIPVAGKSLKTDRSDDNMLISDNQFTQNVSQHYEGGEESFNNSGVVRKHDPNNNFPMLNRSLPSAENSF